MRKSEVYNQGGTRCFMVRTIVEITPPNSTTIISKILIYIVLLLENHLPLVIALGNFIYVRTLKQAAAGFALLLLLLMLLIYIAKGIFTLYLTALICCVKHGL